MPRYERGGIWRDVPLPELLSLTIRGALLNALAFTDGNIITAAKWLGMSPGTMRRMMGLYDITQPQPRRVGRNKDAAKATRQKRDAARRARR